MATLAPLPAGSGTLNVGGAGVLLLSQLVRRAGRVPVPVPAPAVQLVGRAVRRSGLVDFSPEQVRFLEFGRVVDTTRLREDFGYEPRYSTAAAFDDFLNAWPVRPLVRPATVERVERGLLDVLHLAAATARSGGSHG